MNTATTSPRWVAAPRWWLILGVLIAVGLLSNWAIAAGLLALLITQMARPLDFLTSFLVVVGGAAFVANATGGLTVQLGLLTCAILPMLVCYVLSDPRRPLRIPRTPLTWPLLCYLTLSALNTARGVLAGYSRKYIGLELIALLALGSAILVANAFDRRRDLGWAAAGLTLIGVAAAYRGFALFAVTHTHGQGYTLAAPGLVALLLVNLALRSKPHRAAVGLTLLALPMFLQQFITFGRGLWSGCIAGLAASALIYAGYGRGSGPRWKRVGVVMGALAVLGATGAITTALAFDQMDLLREAGTRLLSTFSTEMTYEARSNLIRLGEYAFVWPLILHSPWLGYGVGYSFVMKQAISLKMGEQWYVHQYFLFVWLKQGLVGLALFVWTLSAFTVQGVREARRREDPLESAWFATAAAATIFLAVFSLSNYPFAVVNEMFLLALLWGGAMAMTRQGFIAFLWTNPRGGSQEPV